MESILKYLPALLCCLVPEGCFPGDLLTDSFKSWKFSFPKFRIRLYSSSQSHTPQDCELHQCTITAVQAAFNPGVTDQLTCVGSFPLKLCSTFIRLLCLLVDLQQRVHLGFQKNSHQMEAYCLVDFFLFFTSCKKIFFFTSFFLFSLVVSFLYRSICAVFVLFSL